MIKNNEKRRSLVLKALDEDNEINNIEGYDLKRRYYVYRYFDYSQGTAPPIA